MEILGQPNNTFETYREIKTFGVGKYKKKVGNCDIKATENNKKEPVHEDLPKKW